MTASAHEARKLAEIAWEKYTSACSLGGTDQERRQSLQRALDADEVVAKYERIEAQERKPAAA